MKSVSMSGSLRGNVGKKDAKKQRKEERIPCVLYGGKEQIHFTVNNAGFKKIIFTPDVFLIKLDIDGKQINAILQDVQYHPVTDSVLHADFLEVILEKPVIVAIPVEFTGVAPGVLKGGRLIKKLRRLKIMAMIDDIPDKITISINKLDIGDSVKVKDIKFANLEFLDASNAEVIGVKTARTVVDVADEEEGEEGIAEEGAAEGGDTETKETRE